MNRLLALVLGCVVAVALTYLATVPPLEQPTDIPVSGEALTTTTALKARKRRPTRPFRPPTFLPTTTTVPPTTSTTTGSPPSPVVVEPPPTTAAVNPPASASCGGWHSTVAAYFPPSEVATACRVLVCESEGNPTAENPHSTASGLLQFLDSTWQRARRLVARAVSYARASHAPGDVQIEVGAAWLNATSWAQWECA